MRPIPTKPSKSMRMLRNAMFSAIGAVGMIIAHVAILLFVVPFMLIGALLQFLIDLYWAMTGSEK